jgi:hypothetical protein
MFFLPAYLMAAEVSENSTKSMVIEATNLAELTLSGKKLKYVKEHIEDYAPYSPDLFLNCFQEVGHAQKNSGDGLFCLAFSYEKLGNIGFAITHYIKLAKLIENPEQLAALFSKISALLDQVKKPNYNDPYVVLLWLDNFNIKEWNLGAFAAGNTIAKFKNLHNMINASFKDLLRLAFEPLYATVEPSLFICFDETKLMQEWIIANLLPDLELMGVRPIFAPWHLSIGMNIHSFNSEIQHSSGVLVCLTPEMIKKPKKKCQSQLQMLPYRESKKKTEQKTFVITFCDSLEIRESLSCNFMQSVMNKQIDLQGDNFKAKFDLYSRLLQKMMDRSVDPMHWEKFLQQITMHCQTIFPQ